jgi:UDPglucose 6-dehydrogenase
MAQIVVVGLGYVGLTTSVGLAQLGHEVLGYDVDNGKIETLSDGKSPIFEQGLEASLNNSIKSRRLVFTPKLEAVEAFKPEIVFVCVGTPQDHSGAADLSILFSVTKQLGEKLSSGTILVVKSTVPVGTCQKIFESLNRADLFVASNPEFLREGAAIKDFLNPDRVVVGTDSERAWAVMEKVYRPISRAGRPVMLTDVRSAEIIKYASNSFLATKIAFINEIADFCSLSGGNVKEVARGMGNSRLASYWST